METPNESKQKVKWQQEIVFLKPIIEPLENLLIDFPGNTE